MIALSVGCSVGSLSTGDDPRASLAEGDLVIIPECVAIPSSPSSLVVQQAHVTVKIKRVSGAAAESVPVIFSLGDCPSEASPAGGQQASYPPFMLDEDAGDDDGGIDGPASAGLCGSPFQRARSDASYLAMFGMSIVDTMRCHGASTSVVECVLGRDGTTQVAVQSAVPPDTLGLLPPAPLCIAIRDFQERAQDGGTAIGWRYYQTYLIPSDVVVANTLRVLPAPLSIEPEGPCGLGDANACSERRAVSSHYVGIASSDAQAGSPLLPTQLLQLRTAATFDLSVLSSGLGASATLSSDSSCSSSASAVLRLSLAAGQQFAQFFVCSDRHAGTHTGSAGVTDHPALATTWVDGSGASFVRLKRRADGTVARVDCDGEHSLLASDIERFEHGGMSIEIDDGTPVDLDELCDVPVPGPTRPPIPPDGGSDDAGTEAAEVETMKGACTMPVTITLAGDQHCEVVP